MIELSSKDQWESIRRALAPYLTVTGERARGFSAVTVAGTGTQALGVCLVVEWVAGDAGVWLVVRVPVCPRSHMDPELTLERNATLGCAALLLADGMYWLRVSTPFDSVELRDPARLVALCVSAAQSLSPSVEPTVDGHRLFACYAD